MRELGGYVFDGSSPDIWDDIDSCCRKGLAEIREKSPGMLSDEHDTHHLPMEKDMLMSWIPWQQIAGIEAADITCVLALQAEFGWCGDGMGFVSAVVALQNGGLLAITTRIWEANSGE
ncbi:unnamed protein product [Symbiodinium natans]|uniref:Uncharacterized protein n=1 Tax=Symbiodinium natans TaxID=878477 RepID=A0A812LI54_9DINO|nr:unnamed protein product [Symbiodinium natans]